MVKRPLGALLTRRLVIASTVLALACVALATSPADALKGNRASGKGTDSQDNAFNFRARGLGTAADATGTFQYTDTFGTVIGDVTCMRVNSSGGGRDAVVGGNVTESFNPDQVGLQFTFLILDGPNDSFSFLGSSSTSPPCPTTGFTFSGIHSGRISITE